MRSDIEEHEIVRLKDDFAWAETRNLASPVRLRVKPDRRQRQIPLLPHEDRRKAPTALPIEPD